MKLEYSEVRKTASKLKFRTKAFIDGKFVNAKSGKTYLSINPATGQPLTQIASCDAADVDLAVKAARRSFDAGVWAKRSPAERKHVLLKLADLIEKNLTEIALLDCLDAGKPITDCMTIDTPDTVHCFRWHAEVIDKEYEKVAPTGPGNVAMIVLEPLGVIGAILPWNVPIQMGAWKLGPILATGNSVVVKPARQTSLNVLRLAELAAEAGIPDGVLKVVPGNGSVIGVVLSVLTFDKEEEGIDLANETPYGLTASVYTQDVSRVHRVARALRAGTVSVNCFSEGDATTPFGGFKQSGFVGRDKSIFAHYQYTEWKTIWMQLS